MAAPGQVTDMDPLKALAILTVLADPKNPDDKKLRMECFEVLFEMVKERTQK